MVQAEAASRHRQGCGRLAAEIAGRTTRRPSPLATIPSRLGRPRSASGVMAIPTTDRAIECGGHVVELGGNSDEETARQYRRRRRGDTIHRGRYGTLQRLGQAWRPRQSHPTWIRYCSNASTSRRSVMTPSRLATANLRSLFCSRVGHGGASSLACRCSASLNVMVMSPRARRPPLLGKRRRGTRLNDHVSWPLASRFSKAGSSRLDANPTLRRDHEQ